MYVSIKNTYINFSYSSMDEDGFPKLILILKNIIALKLFELVVTWHYIAY